MVGRGIVVSTTVPQLRAPVGSLPLYYPLHLLQNSLLYHSSPDGKTCPALVEYKNNTAYIELSYGPLSL